MDFLKVKNMIYASNKDLIIKVHIFVSERRNTY